MKPGKNTEKLRTKSKQTGKYGETQKKNKSVEKNGIKEIEIETEKKHQTESNEHVSEKEKKMRRRKKI